VTQWTKHLEGFFFSRLFPTLRKHCQKAGGSENDHNHRPPCLISKSDSATHILSFSGVVIAAQVRLQWTQCKSSLTQMCQEQRFPVVTPEPWYRKSYCVNGTAGFIQWYNLFSYYDELCKNDQSHRASVVARITKDCARALGRGTRSKNSRQSLASAIHTWRSTLRPLRIWGGEWGQYRLLFSGSVLTSWKLEQLFTQREITRTGRWSQTIYPGCCWHLFDKVSWF